MALTTRTINISLRFPTNQTTATVRFIPDLSAGDGQVLLEKYYDATITTGAPGTTLTGSIALPVFIDAESFINYRVQFPRESGVNEHYISVNSGSAIDLSILLAQSLVAAAGYSLDLNSLTDVTITSPTTGEYLRYNGTEWVDSAIQNGDLPSDAMLKSVYDTDTDGIVDQAERIEITVRVRSSDYPSGLTKGTVVYIGGATGNRPYVLKASASSEATSSKTLGILTADIAANADGQCAVSGTLHDLALPTSTYADGDSLWLSNTAGEFAVNTPPAEPSHAVFIGWVARAHPTQGRLVLQVKNGYELDELHGVLITAPVNNEILTYESSTGLWKNKASAALTIGNPVGGGSANRVLFEDASQNLATDSAFTFDSSTDDLTVDAARIGGLSGGASFGHKDYFTTNSYAVQQDLISGSTYINAAYISPAFGRLHFRVNNSATNEMGFDGTYWSVAYDTSNKMLFNVTSTGVATFAAAGSSPSFHFNGAMEVEGILSLTNNGYLLSGSAAVGSVLGDATLAFKGFNPSAVPVDHLTDTNYALRQNYIGDTHLNAPTAGTVYIRKNNSTTRQMVFDGTYWYFEYTSGTHFSTTVNSTGTVAFDATGSAPKFTFADKVEVPDDAYAAGWNGSTEVPTKNAIYDKIESLAPGIPSLTAGSVIFSGGGTTLSQNNARLFWNNSTYRLGINTNTPGAILDVKDDGVATTQLRLTYDNNNRLETQVNGSGQAQFRITGGVGTDPLFAFNDKIIIDNPAGGPTTTPLALDLGYDYGNNTAGSINNAKLFLLNDAVVKTGLGVTETSTDILSDQDIVFYAQAITSTKAERMRIKNNGTAVGIGTASPSAGLHIVKTTEQLRVGYDASNYYTTTVGSTGAVTFDAVGSGAKFRFTDTVNAPTYTVSDTVLLKSISTNFTATTSNQVLDTTPTASYRAVKYFVQIERATATTGYQALEIVVVHDGTTAYLTEYGLTGTSTVLATFDADVSGGNVRLLITPTVTDIAVVASATALAVGGFV